MSSRDDDALSWDGDDDDPTLAGSAAAPTAASLPEGFRAVGKGSEAVDPRTTAPDPGPVDDARAIDSAPGEESPQAGNAALVALGIFAGIYLLLAIGWLLGASRIELVATLFLEPVAFRVAMWLAVLAAPLWFATTLLLTRGARTWMRLAALAAGAVLLIPWPFVSAGVAL